MLPVFWLFFLLLATSLAERHHNLHQAVKHHSTLNDAPHHAGLLRTNRWLVRCGDQQQCNEQLGTAITQQLTAGTVDAHVHTASRLLVLTASADVNPSELSAILLSEQRGNQIESFHREAVNHRKSH